MSFTIKKELSCASNVSSAAFTLPSVLPQNVVQLTALLQASVAAQNHVETRCEQLEAELIAVQSTAEERIQVAQSTAEERIQAIQRAADARIQALLEQLVLARHRQFGSSSEAHASQARLFDEAEVLASTSTEEQDNVTLPEVSNTKPNKPARGKRAPLPAELTRVDIIHDVPEDKRTCPCGTPMVVIGEDVSEQLDIVPMRIRVLRNIRKRYGCPTSSHAPITAALPAQPLPKSNASASLLAMLLTVKYVDGLPLTRFAKVLARHGVTVPDQTLARWVIGCANLLQPRNPSTNPNLFNFPIQ